MVGLMSNLTGVIWNNAPKSILGLFHSQVGPGAETVYESEMVRGRTTLWVGWRAGFVAKMNRATSQPQPAGMTKDLSCV